MKIYLNKINEDWIIDRLKSEWFYYNSEISTKFINRADIIWIISPWLWKSIPKNQLKKKKVVCSIYHIEDGKFTEADKQDFIERDAFVNEYHTISYKSKSQIQKLTSKKITVIPFWINENIWFDINDKNQIREKNNLIKDAFYIGSFQRDTEGADLKSPKLVKGPDRLIEIYKFYKLINPKTRILLTGTRRQYIINRLKEEGIDYDYLEMASFIQLNELYNALDLYIVASRIEGGPQAIIECGLTKTPIISTDVGIAELILPKESIFDMSNFKTAEPNISYAYEKSKQYTLESGLQLFINMFKEVYES